MLAARHAAERLQNCWHGGARSTSQLREAMSAALAEYMTSGDSAEAARCLAELDVPHFHHELVKCGCSHALLFVAKLGEGTCS
jgi:programmed cell death protein 4